MVALDAAAHLCHALQPLPFPAFVEPGQIIDDAVTPLLTAPVRELKGFPHALTDAGQTVLRWLFEAGRHGLQRAFLIGFEREHLIGSCRIDLLGDGHLRAHRVNGDGGTSQAQRFEQPRDGLDLIAFLGTDDLPSAQRAFIHLGADQMHLLGRGAVHCRAHLLQGRVFHIKLYERAGHRRLFITIFLKSAALV